MLQNPRKTLGYKKNMVYKIPPGGEVNHIQPVAYYFIFMGYLRKMRLNQQSDPPPLYINEPPFQISWNCPCNADHAHGWALWVEWMDTWKDGWVCQLSSGVRSLLGRIFIYVHILCTRLRTRCQAM